MLFEKKNEVVNEKVFTLYLAATGYNKDAQQLFGMYNSFKQAYNMYIDDNDPGTYAAIEAGGKKEFMTHKAFIFGKKLIWMNDMCKKLLGQHFVTRKISFDDKNDVIQLSKEFGSFLDGLAI